MKPLSEEARQLRAAGQRDRTAFQVLRRDAESPVEIILFHAQQALEKFMKTALIMEGIVFRRTHDLLELNDRALQAGIALPVASDLLARIGPYAVEFRYLGVIAPVVSVEEAQSAVDALWAWLEKQVDDAAASTGPPAIPATAPSDDGTTDQEKPMNGAISGDSSHKPLTETVDHDRPLPQPE
jgi:HEPN domain-containing protein